MAYVGLLGKIILVLTFGFGALVATADDRELASLDLFHPATLVRLVTSRVRDVQAYMQRVRAGQANPAALSGEPSQRESMNPTPTP